MLPIGYIASVSIYCLGKRAQFFTVRCSSQTWMALIGPNTEALGEVKEPNQFYQQQLAQTIAHLAGQEFTISGIAPVIVLK